MYFIQRKQGRQLETVDEFKCKAEAKEMLQEYQLSDWSAEYYISNRPCKNWKD